MFISSDSDGNVNLFKMKKTAFWKYVYEKQKLIEKSEHPITQISSIIHLNKYCVVTLANTQMVSTVCLAPIIKLLHIFPKPHYATQPPSIDWGITNHNHDHPTPLLAISYG